MRLGVRLSQQRKTISLSLVTALLGSMLVTMNATPALATTTLNPNLSSPNGTYSASGAGGYVFLNTGGNRTLSLRVEIFKGGTWQPVSNGSVVVNFDTNVSLCEVGGTTVVSVFTDTNGNATCNVKEFPSITSDTRYQIMVRFADADGTYDNGGLAGLWIRPAATNPSTPSISSVTAGDSSASVSWGAVTAGASGSVTYTVTSFPDSRTCVTSATSCSVTGLTNGTSYQFRVQATNSAGLSSTSSLSSSVIPAAAPLAPTSLVATPGNGEISLAFTGANANGRAIDYYEYSTDGSTWKQTTPAIPTSPVTITQISGAATNLVNGTSYNVRLRAHNSIGDGTASAAVAVSPGLPIAPTSLAATSKLDQSAALSWTAPTADGGFPISDYIVEYSATGAAPWTLFSDGVSTATTATVTGLTNGTTYTFRVRAKNSIGEGLNSSTATAKPGVIPSKPASLVATPSNQQISVNFVQASDGGYTLSGAPFGFEYTTDGTNWRSIAPTQVIPASISSNTTFTVNLTTVSTAGGSPPQLANGTPYTVSIRAKNDVGNSIVSDAVTATPRTVPDPPTGASAAVVNRTSAEVSFTAPAWNGGAPIAGYTVFSNIGGFVVSGTESPITVTGLLPNTAYTFTVKANNIAGASTASTASSSVTTAKTEPLAPTSVVGTSNETNQSVVTWTAPINNGGELITNYDLQYSSNSGATWTTITPASSPRTVTGLSNGSTYIFRVAARNSIGLGPYSANSAVAIPATTPSTPTGLVATPGNGQISIAFTAGSDGGTPLIRYEYETNASGVWRDAGTAVSPVVINLLSDASGGLINGLSYSVRLRAVNSATPTPASAASVAVSAIPISAPGRPGIGAVTPSVGDPTTVTVAFTAPTADGGSPIIDYTVTSTPGGITASGTTSPITISGLTRGTTYTFRVTANNIVGSSTPSLASANTTIPAVVPLAPTSVSATSNTSTQSTVSWTAPNNGGSAITDYVIEFSIDNGTTWTVVTDGVSDATSYTVTSLTNGTSYIFRVKAINGIGTGPYSANSAAAVPNIPPPPAPAPAPTPSTPTTPGTETGENDGTEGTDGTGGGTGKTDPNDPTKGSLTKISGPGITTATKTDFDNLPTTGVDDENLDKVKNKIAETPPGGKKDVTSIQNIINKVNEEILNNITVINPDGTPNGGFGGNGGTGSGSGGSGSGGINDIGGSGSGNTTRSEIYIFTLGALPKGANVLITSTPNNIIADFSRGAVRVRPSDSFSGRATVGVTVTYGGVSRVINITIFVPPAPARAALITMKATVSVAENDRGKVTMGVQGAILLPQSATGFQLLLGNKVIYEAEAVTTSATTRFTLDAPLKTKDRVQVVVMGADNTRSKATRARLTVSKRTVGSVNFDGFSNRLDETAERFLGTLVQAAQSSGIKVITLRNYGDPTPPRIVMTKQFQSVSNYLKRNSGGALKVRVVKVIRSANSKVVVGLA